jgi:hypothetical protein
MGQDRGMATRAIVHLDGHLGSGVILKWPSGIEYAIQSGGTYCLRPSCEGIFVPWYNDLGLDPPVFIGIESALQGLPWRIASGDLLAKEADAIDAILAQAPAHRGTRVDRRMLAESWEAWVHVTIDPDSMIREQVSGLDPFPDGGVLVWGNSD